MKTNSLRILVLLSLLATSLWFIGSWWYYTCNIKNTCGFNQDTTVAALENNQTSETKPQTEKTKDIQTATVIDTDGDGLSDIEEARLGTDPLLTDTDGDTIPDNQEAGVNLDAPLDSDQDSIIDALDTDDDNDNIPTIIEEKVGTSPLLADTDDDGIPDSKEVGDNPDKPIDTDNDGIINALDTDDDDDGIETLAEINLGTNSLLHDTDGDGLSDLQEVGKLLENPLDSDKDGVIDALDTEEEKDQDSDGLSDALEAMLNTNPRKVDTDGDGINDSVEIGDDTSKPLDSDMDGIIDALDTVDDTDSDNDGLTDAQELKLGSDPAKVDSDDDGINDEVEIGKNIDDPLDTDEDGILNLIDKDDDNDKLSTRLELQIGTNPLSDDSDADGLKDNVELRDKSSKSDEILNTDGDQYINAVDNDDDNDKILTSVELKIGTNPLLIDTDNDGIPDNVEIGENSASPLDANNNGIIDALESSIVEKITDVTTGQKVESSKDTGQVQEVKDKPEIKDQQVDVAVADDTSKLANEPPVEKQTLKKQLEFFGEKAEDSIQPARLYFPFLSSEPEIQQATSDYFEEVVKWMKKDPKHSVMLTGHTDNIGLKKDNLAMGIKRVMVIREMLLDAGAPMTQIDISSKGESEPIEDNSTEQGRLLNRRVEITPLVIN